MHPKRTPRSPSNGCPLKSLQMPLKLRLVQDQTILSSRWPHRLFLRKPRRNFFRGCISWSHFTLVLLRYRLKACSNSGFYYEKVKLLRKHATSDGKFYANSVMTTQKVEIQVVSHLSQTTELCRLTIQCFLLGNFHMGQFFLGV